MNTMSEERMNEIQLVKEEVKKKNVDAIADLLTKMQAELQRISNENVDLKRMQTTTNQKMLEMEARINMLQAMGYRGSLGTGSTVHNKE